MIRKTRAEPGQSVGTSKRARRMKQRQGARVATRANRNRIAASIRKLDFLCALLNPVSRSDDIPLGHPTSGGPVFYRRRGAAISRVLAVAMRRPATITGSEVK